MFSRFYPDCDDFLLDGASGRSSRRTDTLLWVPSAETILRIDPLEYVAVLPFEYLDVQWSPDYRYAAVGLQFGHGGFCGV